MLSFLNLLLIRVHRVAVHPVGNLHVKAVTCFHEIKYLDRNFQLFSWKLKHVDWEFQLF